MRVAWIGPPPTEGHGVSFAANSMLRGLAGNGVELDCYVAAPEEEIPASLRAQAGLRFFYHPRRWDADRWYSSTPLSTFVTGQLARGVAQGDLVKLAARRHAERSYDLVYQFSQIELGRLRGCRRQLPPLVLHPEVHAAGELRWMRREADLARRCEPRLRTMAVQAMLGVRSVAQRRDMHLARSVIAPSRHFADHLARDYGIPQERFQVVPNPIDLDRFRPGERTSAGPALTALFVSRMAVRKGVEIIVELSHRLADLSGRLRIQLAGDWSQWSDYRPLLSDLNGEVATYIGSQTAEVPRLYRDADVLLQPAHYEPFALTVGEALASGCPVIASEEVGAAEEVDRRCCRTVPAGDVMALEAELRHFLAEHEQEADAGRRQLARQEAERLFDPRTVGRQLAEALERAAA